MLPQVFHIPLTKIMTQTIQISSDAVLGENKNDIREELSIYEYSRDGDKWTIWVSPNFSAFEHIEQGLEYLNGKFREYLPE